MQEAHCLCSQRSHIEPIERAIKEIELQFPIEDGSKKSAVQAAREEREEQAEEEHVEAEAAALGETPTARTPHLRGLKNV